MFVSGWRTAKKRLSIGDSGGRTSFRTGIHCGDREAGSEFGLRKAGKLAYASDRQELPLRREFRPPPERNAGMDAVMPGLRILLVPLIMGALWSPVRAEAPMKQSNDARQPVLELWYIEDGRVASAPEVAAFANGSVRVQVGEGELWGTVPEAMLEKLVRTLLESDRLASITTESLEQEIEREVTRTGLGALVPGAATMQIRIRTRNGSCSVEAPAIGVLTTRFPEAKLLESVDTARNRIENLRSIVMVGGVEAAEALTTKAQRQLAAEHGANIPLTVQHLASVRTLTDGSRFSQFVIPDGTASAGGRTVCVFESPGEVPRVTLLQTGSDRSPQ